METLIIQSKSKSNIKLLFDLAKKLGDAAKVEKAGISGVGKNKLSRIEREFAKSLNSVKLIKSGKVKANKLSDLLNGKV